MSLSHDNHGALPARCSLTPIFIISLVIAILMAAASIIGLLNRAVIYPTDDLVQPFVPSDVVNLVALRVPDSGGVAGTLKAKNFSVADGSDFGAPGVLRLSVTGDGAALAALQELG